MNHLTKLHFNLPISSSINPKFLLNAIEKKVFFLAIAIFSTVSLLCFAVFTYLKNRKAVEIKEKNGNINLEQLGEKELAQEEDENIKETEEQVNKEDQEIRDEKKEVPNDKPSQPVNGQVSPEKGEEIKSDPNSKLIPRPISEMSYEENDIKKVFDIYAKQKIDTPIKAECEAYFKKGILVPEDKIHKTTFYLLMDPVFLDEVFDAACESLNDYHTDQAAKEIIYSHFCQLLGDKFICVTWRPNDSILQKKFFNFLQKLLETADKDPYKQSGKTCQRTIDHLFDHKIKPEELATMIMNKAENPYNLIELLIKILKDEKQRKVVEASLPFFKDAVALEKLLKYGYESNVIALLTPQQIEILFQHWMTTLDEDKYLEEISLFIDRLWIKNKSTSNKRVIENILAANPKINLKKLIAKNHCDIGYRGDRLRPYLSGFYVMRYLEEKSHSSTDTFDEILNTAIGFTNPLKHSNLSEDEHTLFAEFLAVRCSNLQLQNVIMSFRTYHGTKQRLIEGFLKAILRSKNLQRIGLTFENYWLFYKEFNVFSPNTEWVLLQEIDNEDVLETVYASSLFLYGKEKDEIRTLLREGATHQNFGYETKYKVKLPEEAINRIVI